MNKQFRLFMRAALVLLLVFSLSGCGSSSSGNDIRYVAIGASDATGIGAFPPTDGYVFRIDDGLDSNCGGAQLFNLGIPGADADTIVDIELPAATQLEPDLVTVFVGGNDLVGGRDLQSFRADLADLLQTLAVDTGATVFIANLPDLTILPRFQEDPNPNVTSTRVIEFNFIIETEADASGAILVDLSNSPLSDVLVSDDGFHPSNEGHEKIAEEFLARIIPRLCS